MRWPTRFSRRSSAVRHEDITKVHPLAQSRADKVLSGNGPARTRRPRRIPPDHPEKYHQICRPLPFIPTRARIFYSNIWQCRGRQRIHPFSAFSLSGHFYVGDNSAHWYIGETFSPYLAGVGASPLVPSHFSLGVLPGY